MKNFLFDNFKKPGINFINVLRTAFTRVDPKRVKRHWQLDWVLTLWGATGVKAAHKYVDEITSVAYPISSLLPIFTAKT